MLGPHGCEVMTEQSGAVHCPYVQDFCEEYQIKL